MSLEALKHIGRGVEWSPLSEPEFSQDMKCLTMFSDEELGIEIDTDDVSSAEKILDQALLLQALWNAWPEISKLLETK